MTALFYLLTRSQIFTVITVKKYELVKRKKFQKEY